MGLILVAAIILLAAVSLVGESLLGIEAKQTGADKSGNNYSIFPSFATNSTGADLPEFASKGTSTVLKKGFDIMLEGDAAKELVELPSSTFAVQPPNFLGISPIPKVEVVAGDEVKAGDIIFYDKKRPEVKYVAPVSGEVVAVNRGAKRSIAEVVILGDKEMKYRTYEAFDFATASREDLVNYLASSGVWPMIRQRPYDVVPNLDDIPKNIFISTFDTAPLAPDLNFVVQGREVAFQKGLDVLNKLTEGKVHLGLNGKEKPAAAFIDAQGVELNWFSGPHPAGNVGVQIHHTDPINAGDKVWVLGVQEVITLGALFTEGRFNAERVVALTGAELKKPTYVKTYLGANIENFVKDNLTNDHVRIVAGDVLSGKQKTAQGFLDFYTDQITVLEEGDEYEMFGWLVPTSSKPSVSNTFPTSALFPDIKYKANTNTRGERRAFVVTGQYEKVLPMDIYPQHLMKAIMANDFERMEGLGLYELSEEDLALCEFTCTSKMPLQKILREGLNTMRDQG